MSLYNNTHIKLEAISKMSFGQISALGSRFKSSTYLRMRDEDPANKRGGLTPGPALTLDQNPIFEMASNKRR